MYLLEIHLINDVHSLKIAKIKVLCPSCLLDSLTLSRSLFLYVNGNCSVT